ncbi:hypothetical protein VAWG001_22550 [Aeromonas dhakensis]|nr:hypothetical protein VAWG001_22550 [Aeromonas dhakensis]
MGGRLKPPPRDVKDPDAIRGASAHPDLPVGKSGLRPWRLAVGKRARSIEGGPANRVHMASMSGRE